MKMRTSGFYKSFAVVCFSLGMIANVDAATIVLSENFDAINTTGGPVALTTSNSAVSNVSVSANSTGTNTTVVIQATPDSTLAFGSTNVNYLAFADGHTAGTPAAAGSFAAISGAYQLDFDFFDPSPNSLAGALRVNFYSSLVTSAGAAGTNQAYGNGNTTMGLKIGNGNISSIFGTVGGGSAGTGGTDFDPMGQEYTLGTLHHLTIVGTMGNSGFSYGPEVSQTLSAGRTFDIWVDGVLVGNDIAYRSSAPTSIDRFTIRADSSGGIGSLGFDNILLQDGFVYGVPEPSTCLLVGMGMLGMVATRRRVK